MEKSSRNISNRKVSLPAPSYPCMTGHLDVCFLVRRGRLNGRPRWYSQTNPAPEMSVNKGGLQPLTHRLLWCQNVSISPTKMEDEENLSTPVMSLYFDNGPQWADCILLFMVIGLLRWMQKIMLASKLPTVEAARPSFGIAA
ncbi:hypothetical protein GALMADRAFT_268155 [Galerina marginata CBS 339.88]|uniref:Uncharacterized protein n=1 Tax=Galerina marginata (strain CBS 339.88) TaxID=685588 RepID=A0A067T6Q5_GALM3|nr:hypothetical protein GALMADRAFT_268155 [Galerina marginata CBS 339.88]